MNENGRSTRPLRLGSPIAWAAKRNPKRSAKASISGTAIISRPVPRNTTVSVRRTPGQLRPADHREGVSSATAGNFR